MMATQLRRWMFRRKNSNTAQRPRTLLTGPGTRENTLWRFWRFVWRNRYAIPAGALKNCASSALDLREPFGSPAIQWAFTMSATPGGRSGLRPKEQPMIIRLSAAVAAICMLSGTAFAQGPKPTDPQIAHIAYTAGQLDVTAAKQAIAKSKNKEVLAFAHDMVRDHEAVNKQALDLVKKLKVTPQDNDTSRALSKQAAAKQA